MRVAVISRWYPHPGDELSGLFVRDQVDALAHVAEVAVVVPVDAEASGRASWGDVALVAGFGPLLSRTWSLWRELRRLSPRPDVVHVHLLAPDALPAWIVTRLLRVPLVVTEHSTLLDDLVRLPRARRQLRFVLGHAECVVAVSSSLAKRLRTYNPKAKLAVVGNVIDIGAFSPSDGGVARSTVITVAPTLEERKGIDLLLTAWADARVPGLRLVTVGEDPGDRFRRMAADLGVADSVDFPGPLAREEIARLLRDAAFYVCASRIETFGVAVAEALAAGTPVLSTRCGGPEDFVADYVGVLVANEDARALAAGLRTMSERADAYDRAALRAYAATRFGGDAFRAAILEVYDSVRRL